MSKNLFGNKGIIFTMDALLALAIFIVVSIAIYSTITPNQTVNVQSSSIYVNAENFLRASDKEDKFSDAFKEIQLGNDPTSDLQTLLDGLSYPTVLRLYGYDGSELSLLLTVNEQDFESSILVRKFLVLLPDEEYITMQDPSGNITINEIGPNEPDQSGPEQIDIEMMIRWYGEEFDLPELMIDVSSAVIGDDSHISIASFHEDTSTNPGFWGMPPTCIDPPGPEPSFCIGTFSLTATVDSDAIVGASIVASDTSIIDLKTGESYQYHSETDIKTLRYGFVELEVETK